MYKKIIWLKVCWRWPTFHVLNTYSISHLFVFYSKYVPLQSLDADIIVHVYIFRDMEQKNVHVYILFIRCSLWKICTCVIIFRDMERRKIESNPNPIRWNSLILSFYFLCFHNSDFMSVKSNKRFLILKIENNLNQTLKDKKGSHGKSIL